MSLKISKDNIDHLLFEVAKEYKKIARNHAEPINIIVVGGGSILLAHNFRTVSSDIDSIVYGNSVFKEAIKNVANANNLSYDWINSNFEFTTSFSEKLPIVAKHYKTFYNVLTVDFVDDEYLIAMKLNALRDYKHDKSDIVGILTDMYKSGKNIDLCIFEQAYIKLYDHEIPKEAKNFLLEQLSDNNFLNSYKEISNEEEFIRDVVTRQDSSIHNERELNELIEIIRDRILEEKGYSNNRR